MKFTTQSPLFVILLSFISNKIPNIFLLFYSEYYFCLSLQTKPIYSKWKK